MPRKNKIKRYQKVYRSPTMRPKANPIAVILVIVGILGLAALGWFLYDPVYRAIMGENVSQPVAEQTTEQPEQSAVEVTPPEQSAGEEPPAEENKEPQPTPEPPEEPVVLEPAKAVYMSQGTLLSPALRADFLARVNKETVNTILFDVKGIGGTILYQSSLDSVRKLEAQVPGAVDLKTVIDEIEAAGFTPRGRVNTFRDSIAAFGLAEDSMVMYRGSEWAWLDNSRELGGKAWLNPFKEISLSYNLAVLDEIMKLGLRQIQLESVTYPVGYSTQYCDYGVAVTNQSKLNQLLSYLKRADETAAKYKATLTLYLPSSAFLQKYQDSYAYSAPQLCAGRNLLLGVMPSLYGNGFANDTLTLERPIQQPYQTITKVLEAVLPMLSEDTKVSGMIQCYTASNAEPINNLAYTANEIAEEVRALEDAGIEGVVYYTPAGGYLG